MDKGNKKTVKVDLYNVASMPIERFVKVAGMNSPDDPSLDEYWRKRKEGQAKKMWAKFSKGEQIAKNQGWVCPICKQYLSNGEKIETHHIVPRAKGGSDDPENLVHLHEACHKAVHSSKPKLNSLK